MGFDMCSCCYKQDSNLTMRRSSLVSGQRVALCRDCLGHELRSVVILCGRTNGPGYIKKQLLDKLYCGSEILARDLV